MSQHEIETKWYAAEVTRERFNQFIFSTAHAVPHKLKSFKNSGGPDHYFTNDLGFVARHRDGDDLKELTVKARVSEKHITDRIELNVPLDLKLAEEKVVHAFLRTLGFNKEVTITKDCDIYQFKVPKTPVKVTVVWYEVRCKGFDTQNFIEVEVDGGTQKQRMKNLKMWEKIVEKKLKLSKVNRSKDSLYEIYTDKRYRMVG